MTTECQVGTPSGKSMPPKKPADLKFNDVGDLWLAVGKDPSRNMLVHSRVLCRVSKDFHRMLRGGFAEGNPQQGNWVVSLPDDDHKAFAMLMDIAHGLYLQARSTITCSELYKLCILTNKYDVTRILCPLASRWFEGLIQARRRCPERGLPPSDVRGLEIWVQGTRAGNGLSTGLGMPCRPE
ncbi:hypothetical protein ACJZ2D_016327 [Fusarium nematophilum]